MVVVVVVLMTRTISLPFLAECNWDPSTLVRILHRFHCACSAGSSQICLGTNVLLGFAGHHKDRTSEVYRAEHGSNPLPPLQLPQQGPAEDGCGTVLVR